LITLNSERAAEEAAGTVRWLRPEFQAPEVAAGKAQRKQTQTVLGIEETAVTTTEGKRPWPTSLPDQMRAVYEVLAGASTALAETDIAACFTARGAWKKRLPKIIDTLVAVGRARKAKGRVQAV
jgi:hypothetical protein